MAKIEGVIKAEIIRLAKREVRAVFRPLKREVWQMSTKLSNLSKGFASLNRMAKELHLEEKARPKLEATPEEVKVSRLTPERISRLRKKLGISRDSWASSPAQPSGLSCPGEREIPAQGRKESCPGGAQEAEEARGQKTAGRESRGNKKEQS